MIEIQCTSCLTRYRIEPSVLPAEKPTFKCSRCGHVFSADPRRAKSSPPSTPAFKRTIPEAPKLDAAPSPSPDSQAQPAAAAPSIPESRSSQGSEEHNPLARSFAEREDFKSGENLSFDFADDFGPASEPVEPSPEPVKEARWQVGTIESPAGDDFSHGPSEMAEAVLQADASGARYQFPDAFARAAIYQPQAEEPADVGRIHSSGFFVVVFFLMLLSFTAISVSISNQAAASRDLLSHIPGIGDYFAPPAPTVALRDIHAEYQRLKGDQPALMISGHADNLGQSPLHAIQLAIELIDPAQQGLARQAIYCGNQISPRMIAEMTPRELEFFGKLDPPHNFVINPGQSSSFLAVFVNPPAQSHGFRIAVVDARPPDHSGSPGT